MQKKQKYTIFLCWLVYTIAYLGRYSYNSNITLIESEFGITHADSGLVATCFFFAYGFGQIVNGLLCRKYNKKYVLAIALALSSAINFAVFAGVPFAAYKYLWFINGALQSVLWSSLISVLSTNLETANLKKAIVVMSTTTSVGTFMIYGTSSLVSLLGNFRITFIIASAALMAVALLWFLSFGKCMTNSAEAAIKTEKEATKKKAVERGTIWLIVILAAFAVIDNLTKDGLQTWVPSILKENFGLQDSLSIILSLTLPILGVFGAVLVTLLNKWIKNFISLAALFFGLSAVSLVGVLMLIKTPYWGLVLLLFGFIVCFMHGINNIVTNMMPMYMRDKIDSGMIAGILNGFCYVGSTISSYGLGLVATGGGWNGVFTLLTCACALPVVISLVYVLIAKLCAKNSTAPQK